MKIAVIKGDGIGQDVTDATLEVVDAAISKSGAPTLDYDYILAGAGYFAETGSDIEPDGEERAGAADAIFLGAIGLPAIRHADGTEIAPHLRLRDTFGLYAGVRPVKAYPNAPQRLADPRAAGIDMVILRESTEGLFYSASTHGRSDIRGDEEVRDTLRITRPTTEKLHRFAFKLAERRKAKGKRGRVTCVDKANVFASMAFFRKIFDEIAAEFPNAEADYAYVDAQALNLIRAPWDFDVMVMENMFGDILTDEASMLAGSMGMLPSASLGETRRGLYEPIHGSAPDIAGQGLANPCGMIASIAMMLRLSFGLDDEAAAIDAAIDSAIGDGIRTADITGGDHPSVGTVGMTDAIIQRLR